MELPAITPCQGAIRHYMILRILRGGLTMTNKGGDPPEDPAVTKSTIEFFTVKYPEPAHP